MKLISVNIGKEQVIHKAQKSGLTGIFKIPADGPVQLTAEGFTGDAIVDRKNHGGPDQAVYVYTDPDYAFWAAELGRKLEPGTFGENLTLSALESASLRIGDSLRVGEILLQITAPRIPCSTLAARMNDTSFVKRFRAAERPGFYCRVLQTGQVKAGDPVELVPYPGESVTVLEMFREFYEPSQDEAEIRRYLAAPISIRDRAVKQEQLSKLR